MPFTRVRRQTTRACSVVLCCLSVYVLAGWMIGSPLMVRVVPGSVAMSINTALMFLMSGIALEMARRYRTSGVAYPVLSGAIVLLSGAILAEHLFDIDLGIDLAGVHDALGDGHAKPGRTAPNACLGFLFAGLALSLNRGQARTALSRLALGLSILTYVIGIAGLAGYLLGLDTMYRIASLNRMALLTSVGMTALGLGVWALQSAVRNEQQRRVQDDAGRITRLAGILLVVFAIATGMSGFALLRDSFEHTAAQHHAHTARTVAVSISTHLRDASLLAVTIAERPLISGALMGLAANPGNPLALAQLRDAMAAFDKTGHTATIAGAEGALLHRIGKLPDAPSAGQIPFASAAESSALYWHNGFHVRITHRLRSGNRIIGTVVTDRKLTALDSIVNDSLHAAGTTEVLLCAKGALALDCYPSRITPEGLQFPLTGSKGGLPIGQALSGPNASAMIKDPRGVQVIAGLAPLPGAALAVVAKTDLSELYTPLRRKLHVLLAAVGIFVAIGTILLRRWVQPLIVQIVAEKERIKSILDNSNDAFIAIGADGCVTDWNRQAELTLGIPAEHAIGRDLAELIIPERLRAAHNAGFARFLRSGTGRSINNRVEVTACHASGREIPVELSVTPIKQHGGVGASAFLRDLTEQKIAQAKAAEQARVIEEGRVALDKSQRLEAVGKLTGGIAHDFNNVLQVLRGNLELLAKENAHAEPLQRRIGSAMQAVDRGAGLSSQLLAFARRQPLQPQPTHIGRVVRSMEDMLRRALGDAIEIKVDIAGDLWNAMVDPSQLEHVILNLAINARDAMKDGGQLVIEASNAILDDEYATIEPDVQAGQFIMLAISDTGCGMDKAVLEKAFEPFFTTKPEGEGTGLGLSMAYGFVKQSYGHINIYSEPGEGTTLRIYLPRTGEMEVLKPDNERRAVERGTESILVVEDDPAVQATVTELLAGLGYRVMQANDASQALQLLEGGAQVDLLFTDVVMPGPLRSPELAKRARQILPNLKVLFTSGYTQNAMMQGGRLDPDVELLSKPYRREQLARKVRAVLGPSGAMPPPLPVRPTIAFVEDNDDFRMVGAELIGLLGYEVDSFASAEDALDAVRSGRFTVLLTDVSLPGMSGLQLAMLAKQAVPTLSIILATGFGDTLRMRLDIPHQILAKPFAIDDLERCLGNAQN